MVDLEQLEKMLSRLKAEANAYGAPRVSIAIVDDLNKTINFIRNERKKRK
jgi:hypothetical protein